MTKTVNLRDLPEELVRRAKACAALHGMSLKDFVIQALEKATQGDLPFMVPRSMIASARSVREGKRRAKKR